MLSKSRIKHITSLKVKKFRDEHNQFIAEGEKLVMDLAAGKFTMAGIYASPEWIDSNTGLIRSKSAPVFETSLPEMTRITALSSPSPVLAVINIPDPVFTISPSHDFTKSLSLALDDIRDPGNLGTIIRIADWFGIENILCSESCVDIYNPKVVQASMGSIARVNMVSCNLPEKLAALPGCPVYGAFLEGDSIFTQTFDDHGIIVIGNESHGISPELVPFITRKLFIPSFGSSESGKAESLNASIATAIICAEFRRNQQKIQ
ncbi:MAG: RNA methyltransferase [Bacteroidales bacterium]|nr:RNA methyltransferase [Bacteroidales bacterium]